MMRTILVISTIFESFGIDKQVGYRAGALILFYMLMNMIFAEVSRQLGFLRFKTVEDSKEFLEQNHPFIHLYGPTGERSTKVRIAYSKEREDRARVKAEGDWTCRMVLSIASELVDTGLT